MKILKVENLVKVYGTGDSEVKAVNHVSFEIEQGEMVAVTGPSGSGKSTLLHILGGLDVPDEGRAVIDGKELTKMNRTERAVFRRRNIGFVYQFFNLVPILNVRENIAFPCLLDGKEADEQRLDEILEILGLGERRNHFPGQLSGGQQQRVAIGRALITRPALILADEPTGNLDKKNGEEVLRILKEASRKYNQTILIITHDQNVAACCDRQFYIEDGKLWADCTKE